MVIKYSLSDFEDEQLFDMCGVEFTFIRNDGLRFKGTLDNYNTHRRLPHVLIYDENIRLPISLFKYIESEVDLFLMFGNDTPFQINEPSKLNWRDASKELPIQIDDDGLPSVCLVVSFHNNKPSFYKDWVNKFTKKWTYSVDGEAKYWIYLSEIPLPKE